MLPFLEPYTSYKFLLSGATDRGEGPKSTSMQVTTDHAVPIVPQIMNISYECDKDVTVHWMPLSSPISFYRVLVYLSGKPAAYNTTEQKVILFIYKAFFAIESDLFRWI